MKMHVGEDGAIVVENLFVGITLKTSDGEEMSIAMRDSGFEFTYQGELYEAKEGRITHIYTNPTTTITGPAELGK